jgi:hypothetical protein
MPFAQRDYTLALVGGHEILVEIAAGARLRAADKLQRTSFTVDISGVDPDLLWEMVHTRAVESRAEKDRERQASTLTLLSPYIS